MDNISPWIKRPPTNPTPFNVYQTLGLSDPQSEGDQPAMAPQPQIEKPQVLPPSFFSVSGSVKSQTKAHLPIMANMGNGLDNMISDNTQASKSLGENRDSDLSRLLGMRDNVEQSLAGKSTFDRMDLSPLSNLLDGMYGSKTSNGYVAPATGMQDTATMSGLNDKITAYTKAKNDEKLGWQKMLMDAQKNSELMDMKLAIAGNKTDPYDLAAFKASLKTQNDRGSKVQSHDVNTLASTDEAISLLGRVRENTAANKDKIGPVSGMARFNPYSDTRQMQALVDQAKQIIGKGLEGGVLRKEDEEKYAKILPTMNDTYDQVTFKLGEIEKTINTKKSSLLSNLDQAGYNIGGFNQSSQPQNTSATSKYDRLKMLNAALAGGN